MSGSNASGAAPATSVSLATATPSKALIHHPGTLLYLREIGLAR
jgi:hypothetical protein